MDTLDRLLRHDADTTRQLLELAAGLDDAVCEELFAFARQTADT